VAAAIADAELLVAYAARRGLLRADSPLEPIIVAKRALASSGLDEEHEQEFWRALNAAADLVRPATIEGLRSMEPSRTGGGLLGWLARRASSPADGAIRRYRLWAMTALLVLSVTQIYYIVGATALADITTIESEPPAREPTAGDDEPHTRRQSIRLTTSYRTLRVWNKVWWELAVIVRLPGQIVGAPPASFAVSPASSPADGVVTTLPRDGTPDPVGVIGVSFNAPQIQLESIIEYTNAKFALTALQGYILPFLYGLLGTCVYILRSLSTEIRNSSYSTDVAYRLRMPLGALAGVAIAWVVVPESDPGLVRSIPPLGLAFLAGYSVEVLFAAMDRFIAAFSNEGQPSPRGAT
jgi:hypothetical protein